MYGSEETNFYVWDDDDDPCVAPFLSTKHFNHKPVERPIFYFSPNACYNIQLMRSCKTVLDRLDNFIQHNNLHTHTCLILQAGSQATMRLAAKWELRPDWNTNIEIPFCLFITQNGECPRTLDIDDLDKQVKWLEILEEVLLPLNNVEHRYIPIIAPHHMNKFVKDVILKSKLSNTNRSSENTSDRCTNSSSSGYESF